MGSPSRLRIFEYIKTPQDTETTYSRTYTRIYVAVYVYVSKRICTHLCHYSMVNEHYEPLHICFHFNTCMIAYFFPYQTCMYHICIHI